MQFRVTPCRARVTPCGARVTPCGARVTPCGGWGYAPAMQAGERAPLGLRGLGEDFDFSP